MRKQVLITILVLATALAQVQLTEYGEPAYNLEKTHDMLTVKALSEDSGYIFVQFPAEVSGDAFSLSFDYMIKSKNPEYDPSIFIRVYPQEQQASAGWIKTRTNQECYYYTASNGEIIPVGGNPVLTGRLEAYGRSGCIDKDCDYYKQDNTVIPIPDSTWLSKSIPVNCPNNGTVYIVLEMNKKNPDWIEWNFRQVKVDGNMILFARAEEEQNQTSVTENRTSEENKSPAEEQEKEQAISMLNQVLEYSAIALLAIIVVAGIMFIRKKKKLEVNLE